MSRRIISFFTAIALIILSANPVLAAEVNGEEQKPIKGEIASIHYDAENSVLVKTYHTAESVDELLRIATELPTARSSGLDDGRQRNYEVTQVIEEKVWDDGRKEMTLASSGITTREWGSSNSNSAVTAIGTINYSLQFQDVFTPQKIKFNYNKGEIISKGVKYPSSCELAYHSSAFPIGGNQHFTCGAVTQQSFQQNINKGYYQLSPSPGSESFFGQFWVNVPGLSALSVNFTCKWEEL